jgi:pSer/pThr/pTyr-binding forkhead associated (FHA) protein
MQHSDADTPESITTPSRKRRRVSASRQAHDLPSVLTGDKLNGAPERTAAGALVDDARVRITESVASNDSNTTLPNGADADAPLDPVERQNTIIAALRTPSNYTPNAAIDYANELQARKNQGTNIAAFAKIAARDWCFFVQKTILLIGRADSMLRPNPPSSSRDADGLPVVAASDVAIDPINQWGIDIDLGPDRQVSRIHAQIDFDGGDQTWYITVNSRNGLKVDDHSLPKGSRHPLHSGACIWIMGTQMVFLLANQEDEFHPLLYRQVKNEVEGESDNDGNPTNKSLPHAHPSGPTPKRESYDPFPPSSHPRNKQQSSQAYANQMTSTPGRPPPGTPMTFGSTDPRETPSTFPRGIRMDGPDEVDYSLDSSKDIKPPHSYAQLIGQAIVNSPEQMLTLAHIYQFIKDNYAFFRHTNGGWQNSIRHNLSLSKSFEKVARRTDEPGKGMKWKIADDEREEFMKKLQMATRPGSKTGPIWRPNQSGPSSPAIRDAQVMQATERLVGITGQPGAFGKQEPGPRVKSPPGSATPPLASYPMANESYTPDRGPRSQNPFQGFKHSPTQGHAFQTPAKRLFQDSNAGPGFAVPKTEALDNPSSPPNADPVRANMSGLRGAAANSPPTLYSDAATNSNGAHDTSRLNNAGLITPLVTRHAPRLAPPSTAQVPSQYMNFSSPAPFWKYVDLPSTPAKQQLDLSPIKMKRDDDAEKEEEDTAQPSSPPLLPGDSAEPEDDDGEENDNTKDEDEEDMGPDSPSRTVSRPVSRRDIAGPTHSRSNSNVNSFMSNAANGGMVRGASLASFEEEPEEEESFDLSK